VRRPDIDDSQVVALYTIEHLTVRQIGARLGVSGTAVWKRLKRAGVSAYAGEHVQAVCVQCGNPIDRTRARFRITERSFCSKPCYYLARESPNLVISRWGGIQARQLVNQHFPLQTGYIVHHEDRDECNNALGNLRVFASQSDHGRYHHGKFVIPLWDGRNCRCEGCLTFLSVALTE